MPSQALSGGINSQRIRSIPSGTDVRITHAVDDNGRLHQLLEGKTFGQLYNTQFARVRLNRVNPLFAKQNLSCEDDVTDLMVEARFLTRRKPFFDRK